jgi:hypothetical protein
MNEFEKYWVSQPSYKDADKEIARKVFEHFEAENAKLIAEREVNKLKAEYYDTYKAVCESKGFNSLDQLIGEYSADKRQLEFLKAEREQWMKQSRELEICQTHLDVYRKVYGDPAHPLPAQQKSKIEITRLTKTFIFAKILKILDGIEQTECAVDSGWWETYDVALFGQGKVKEINEYLESLIDPKDKPFFQTESIAGTIAPVTIDDVKLRAKEFADRFKAAMPAQQVPEGWRLVPSVVKIDWSDENHVNWVNSLVETGWINSAAGIIEAVLSAAPKPEDKCCKGRCEGHSS